MEDEKKQSNIGKYANAKGSKKRTGNISDAKLFDITKIPQGTIRDWKKSNKGNWRFHLYLFLKSFTKDQLQEQMNKSIEIYKKMA